MLSEVQSAAAIASHAHILRLTPPSTASCLSGLGGCKILSPSMGRDGKGEFMRDELSRGPARMKSLIMKEYEAQRTLFRSHGATGDEPLLGMVGIKVGVVKL